MLRARVAEARLAKLLLTRIPVGYLRDPIPATGASAWGWPLAGAVAMLPAGLIYWALHAAGFGPTVAALGLIFATTLLTGAMHEDGLADVADGFGGGETKAKKLKIMKDSRIGAFGVLAVVFSVGIRAGILGGLPSPGMAALALIAAAVLSRGLLPAVMAVMDPARKSGLAFRAGTPDQESWVTALVLGGLLGFLFLGPGGGLMALAMAIIAVAALAWLAERQVGGFTGDVLGAQQQAAEIAVLAAAAAAL